LRFAAVHVGVSLVHFGERKLFNDGANAGEFGETQSVLGVGGDAGGPALHATSAQEKWHDRRLDGFGARADHEQ